jgi:hypothetical protein
VRAASGLRTPVLLLSLNCLFKNILQQDTVLRLVDKIMTFQVLTAASMNMIVFWDNPYMEDCHDDGGSKHL